jgi:peptidoglycan/LPS O-acetylase OafA/YrhL
MYLLHMICRHVGDAALTRLGRGGEGLPLFAVTLVLTIAAAELSYRYYESPFLQLKRRFEKAR